MRRAGTSLTALTGLLLATMPAVGQDADTSDFDQLGRLRPVTEVEPGTFSLRAPESILRVYVGRAGLLGGLGHNHVVHTRSLSGSIHLTSELVNSSAEFSFPIDSLVVDDSQERERAGEGYTSRPGDSAKASTRENMLGPDFLAATEYPDLTVRVATLEAGAGEWLFSVKLAIKGNTVAFQLPARLTATADNLRVSAEFTLDHAELGLEPFRAVGGTLRVAEELRFEMDLQAQRD